MNQWGQVKIVTMSKYAGQTFEQLLDGCRNGNYEIAKYSGWIIAFDLPLHCEDLILCCDIFLVQVCRLVQFGKKRLDMFSEDRVQSLGPHNEPLLSIFFTVKCGGVEIKGILATPPKATPPRNKRLIRPY